MKHKSSDGLMSSNDPSAVATWERIGRSMADEQRQASAMLREMGVKLEHPDDGWVDREGNTVAPCYPAFDLGPVEGDLIALGWPWSGYRIVRCTEVERQRGVLLDTIRYHFEDTAFALIPTQRGASEKVER